MNSQPIILDTYQYRNQSMARECQTLSIYIHIPFCTSKCTYCAFNTYTKMENLIPAFVDALNREIAYVARNNPYKTVGTVFFGGGTPTLLSTAQFESILSGIRQHFTLSPSAEITTEANPNDLSIEYLSGLRRAGINRISIGMQSANDEELRLFARRHDRHTVIAAVKMARLAGFDNINLDLIYGAPRQTMATWQDTVQTALAMDVQHFSLYALGLEAGTPMDDWVNSGQMPEPDDDLAADMYDYATEQLAQAGYQQYEISNWCRDDLMCCHNLQYWRNEPYIGVGPGAHGFAAGVRYAVMRAPAKYISTMLADDNATLDFPLTPAVDEANQLSVMDEIGETLIMSFRLLDEGVHLPSFQKRFGVDLMDLHGEKMAKFLKDGLLIRQDERIKLTENGRLLSNIIFRELI
ncbi:MAG: radical SAM family heme chaperone HemW [Anaerolineaceae bacterium]|nr:MAG: radical SAM family heme chaperone HemW [Anaerolineaceae bacterium]